MPLPPGMKSLDSVLQLLDRTHKSQPQPTTPGITETGTRCQRHAAMLEKL